MSRTNAMQCATLEEDPFYKSKKEWLGSEFFAGSAVAHMMNEKGVLSDSKRRRMSPVPSDHCIHATADFHARRHSWSLGGSIGLPS